MALFATASFQTSLLRRYHLPERLLYGLAEPQLALDTLNRFEVKAPTVLHSFFARSASRTVPPWPPAAPQFSAVFQLLTLFANSPALTNLLFNQLSLLPALFPIERETQRQYFARLKKEDQLLNSPPAAPLRQLRLFKLREFIRIALADYLHFDSFQETLFKLSTFADCVLEQAFRWAGLERYSLAVIALGKLGAQELNYASDVDLIFLLEEPLSAPDLERDLQYFIKLIHLQTSEGRVFQVDLNLRPEGATGRLASTAAHYRAYYKNRARPWEIQALLKARLVVASPLVKKKFFIRELEHWRSRFIYESGFSSERMLASISTMKHTIEKELVHKKAALLRSLTREQAVPYNVKLANGGIRDLEFLVQFLQLHHSKLSGALRLAGASATLKAVKILTKEKLIPPATAKRIKKNYRFLRRLEHYLQLRELLPVRYFSKSQAELNLLSLLFQKKLPSSFCAAEKTKAIKHFLETWNAVVRQNRDVFNNTFQLTLAFLAKRKAIQKRAELRSVPELVRHHLQRLDSDYFLTTSTAQIVLHLSLLRSLSSAKPVVIDLSFSPSSNALKFTLALVAFDFLGAFSVFCGLLALSGINLISGTSYTYRKLNEAAKETHLSQGLKTSFFKQQKKIYTDRALRRPKIICSLTAEFRSLKERSAFSRTAFTAALEKAFLLLQEKKLTQVREEQIFKIARLDFKLRRQSAASPDLESEAKPIYVNVDNTSNSYYTILELSSEDSFMFLHEFTQALLERKFYLSKIHFSTKRGVVYNRLFLLDENQNKIEAPRKIAELKTSLVFIKYFSHYLYLAPNPLLALRHFSRLLQFSTKDYEQLFNDAIVREQLFSDLAKVLGTTPRIFEDFFRTQFLNLSTYLVKNKRLTQPHTRTYLQAQLRLFLEKRSSSTSFSSSVALVAPSVLRTALEEEAQLLNDFKDRQLFYLELRLLSRHVKSLEDFCREVVVLAEVVMERAFLLVQHWLVRQLRWHRHQQEEAIPPALAELRALVSAVGLAFGKWGAGEMGYASDLEFMFVYSIPPKARPWKTLLKTLYLEAAQLFPLLIKSKKNGIFELDFRLRPDGENSPLAVSLERFENYYHPDHGRGHPFERLAFTRMRVICGQADLAEKLLLIQQKFVYSGQPLSQALIEEIRQRQLQNFVTPIKNKGVLNPVNLKFSRGGLVEVEYFLQRLQLEHGLQFPALQKPLSTLQSVKLLVAYRLLTQAEGARLSAAYKLLRAAINCLRLVRGNAKDLLLPERDSLEFIYLARRLRHFDEVASEEDSYAKIIQTLEWVSGLVKRKTSLAERHSPGNSSGKEV